MKIYRYGQSANGLPTREIRIVERRPKIEVEHEAQLFGQGLIFFNLENWYAAPWIVRTALKLAGLYGRARRNADHVVVKQHSVAFANLPLGI